MPDLISSFAALRSSTSAFLLALERQSWTDADLAVASLLPGWTRGHVLTHLARNADGIARTVSGALRGEVVARYPGGTAQRDADIEAGARRAALEMVGDVRDSAERLDRVFAAAADAEAWAAQCDSRTVGAYLMARWREVEIHRVDLAGEYGPADWPPEFVTYLVPDLLADLGQRSQRPLHVEITSEESITTDLPGSHWAVGDGEPEAVVGPDWAVAAWLAGRANAARGALSATPELAAWM